MPVKACLFRQVRTDKPSRFIQPIGDKLFSSHGAKLVFRLFLFPCFIFLHGLCISRCIRRGHSRDGNIQWLNGIQRTCKRYLHRPAHLTGVWPSGHHRAECTHVIKHLTGFSTPCIYLIFPFRRKFCPAKRFCPGYASVNIAGAADQHFHPVISLIGSLYIIPDPALDRHIRNIPVKALGVCPRRISHIRIPVGVSVPALNIKHELITILNCHACHLSSSFFPE